MGPKSDILHIWKVYRIFIIPPLPKGPRRGRGVYCFTSVRLSVLPSVQDIFRHIFLSNCWWQKSDIWSQASYRYTMLWVAFLDPSDSYFLFADLVGFYTHWTYMHIFCHIFLSNYWWQKYDIWSQASYRYPILWEAFFDPSDSYFLFAEERGYHKWALAHISSCFFLICFSFFVNRCILLLCFFCCSVNKLVTCLHLNVQDYKLMAAILDFQ